MLVLYQTRRDAQIVVVGDRELQRILGDALPGGIDYYSEFIDPRLSHNNSAVAFRDSLRLKYEHHQFDVVIAIGDAPLDFVNEHRDVLFPGAPVVFFTNRSESRRIANSTGLMVESNFSATLGLAAALQPGLRRVFVITTASGSNNDQLRAQLRPFESRFAISYLSGLRTTDLEARLASLPPQSAVYYYSVDRDGSNQNFHPLDYLDRVTAVTTAPVYSWVDSAMDHGIVGGYLKNQALQVRTIGAIALRVLRGEPADSIPISSPDLNVSEVDWRQLRHWGISESRVPAGTMIRFREPSAWDRYKIYILGVVVAILAQTALIAGLLLQSARRREAERKVLGSQAALRATYERNRGPRGAAAARTGDRARADRARAARRHQPADGPAGNGPQAHGECRSGRGRSAGR